MTLPDYHINEIPELDQMFLERNAINPFYAILHT